MLVHQFFLEGLGHASYVVGSERTGQAIVVDPRRDVDGYFTYARDRGMRITHVVDTHGHNDYLTGLVEIAQRADVEAWASSEGDYGYDHRPVRDREHIELGEVGIEILHTPGHTPEHISLVLYDGDHSSDEPAILLSGGALLVGDLARPDLLEGPEEAKQGARAFCRTIQEKILTLPDHVEVFPTHVSGSLCGGSIGSRLSTTVGYERRTNEILAWVSSSDEFVTECLKLDNLPAVPPYWKRMRKQNLAGPKRLGVLREPPALQPEELESRMDDGALVLDTRSPEAFGGGHIPGALNVALTTMFATWAGTVLPAGVRVLLVVDRETDVWRATWDLLRIGYDVPVGWLAGGARAWRVSGRPLEMVEQVTVHELRERVEGGDVHVLDVRQPAEWESGHIAGAIHITGAELPDRLDEVPEGKPVAVVCGSGYRSSVSAALVAKERGLEVINVLGGMGAWKALDYPTGD